MTTVILGAGGMLGRALRREFPNARPLTRQELDLTDDVALGQAIVPGVELVLNAAADTRVDLAESDSAHLAANDRAVGILAELCARVGARLVHVSTDYVFDGKGTRPYREGDPIDPVNAYGRGKRGGEERALANGADVLVIRTSWVFGTGGANFPETILKQAETGKTELKVVSDQVGRPTYTPDLAHAIRLLSDLGARGLFHFANQGETTWYGFATETLRLAGRQDILVRPCSSTELPRPARRPSYSVLDTSLYEKTVGERPRHWREALAQYLVDRVPATAQTPA